MEWPWEAHGRSACHLSNRKKQPLFPGNPVACPIVDVRQSGSSPLEIVTWRTDEETPVLVSLVEINESPPTRSPFR
jgi:hypothetical protein